MGLISKLFRGTPVPMPNSEPDVVFAGPCRPYDHCKSMATGTFHSKVAGVTFKNTDGSSRQDYIRAYCKQGMDLILKREPDNPYDNNAVGVWIKSRALIVFTSEVQIGYLNAEVAEEIADYIDNGGTVVGKITEVTGGTHGKPTFGVNILLTKM